MEAYGKALAGYNIARALARRGHEVHIFTLSQTRKGSTSFCEKIHIHRCSSLFGYKSERFSFDILRKPLSYSFDIVHIHSGVSMTVLGGYSYATRNDVPLLLTWHGDSVRDAKSDRYGGIIPRSAAFAYGLFVPTILSRADCIISVSESYIDQSKFLGRFKEKVVTIPNGLEINDFLIRASKEECKAAAGLSGKIVVLFVGSIYPLKGLDILLQAIPRVVKKCGDAVLFVFAGSGATEKYVDQAHKLGICDYVKFVGYINEEKSMYYRASDLFVLPSLVECFPLAILEAMASGVPVVASSVGGVADIVNGGNGVLVPPGNPNLLAEAINQLLMNEPLREEMGVQARKTSEKYSWDKIAQMTERAYARCINERIQRT